MKTRAKIDGGYNQMRWVVLLLVIAVVLPTVCLLWFITQVVRNERFAVRQKLIKIYQEQLIKTVQQTEQDWQDKGKFLYAKEDVMHPYRGSLLLTVEKGFDGLVVYDAQGKRIYPVLTVDAQSPAEELEEFNYAWQLEFIERDYAGAAKLYEKQAQAYDDHIRLTAIIGKSRCLAKLDRLDKAINECKQVAFSPLEKTSETSLLVLIGNARLLLLNLIQGNAEYNELFNQTFDKLTSMVYSVNEGGFALPADHNLFLAQKLAEIAKNRALSDDVRDFNSPNFKGLLAAEELSIRVSENFPEADTLENIKEDKLQCLPFGDETLYCVYHKIGGVSVLALLSRDSTTSIFAGFEADFGDSGVSYRIIDEYGRFIADADEQDEKPFVTAALGEDFPGWKIDLSFEEGDIFEKAASHRIAVYIWTGVLVIVLIFIVGIVAAQAVRKQVKLNRLKNDFIATVSHELKTPLASIRLLVDTLLEGNYKNQQQADEYFHLVSKENERLTRLIENFLTFSRMERNKQAFAIVGTKPASIAFAANDAVKTKFANGRSKLDLDIGENLPDVLADRDAIVMVLVNLLDNAYKYSNDDKHITLKVSARHNQVCFSVSDNGIGLSHRAVKKIFKKFYQVDQSLSRRAEGCGLGLSIAKFIVDAHKGSISVDSKIGQGSTFTVKLPVAT